MVVFRLGLLPSDLWPWISFMKKKSRKDDLFFLSPFRSLSLCFSPSLSSFAAGWFIEFTMIYFQTRMRTCMCDWLDTHKCWKTRIHFLNTCQDRSKTVDQNRYRNICIHTNSIPWPMSFDHKESLSSANPPHSNSVIPPWPTKPIQQVGQTSSNHGELGSADL